MKELKIKLAKWAGFKLIPRFGGSDMTETLWRYPDDTPFKELPNFTESLDACDKWLMPKVAWQQIIFQSDDYCGITVNDELYEAQAETLALALCQAIEKLIDGEVK